MPRRRRQKSPSRRAAAAKEENAMVLPDRIQCWSCDVMKDRRTAFCNNCGAETMCTCKRDRYRLVSDSDKGTGRFCTACGRARGALDERFKFMCAAMSFLLAWALVIAVPDMYHAITTGKEDRGTLVGLSIVVVVLVVISTAVSIYLATRANTPVSPKTHPLQATFEKRVDRMEAVLNDLMDVCKDAATYNTPDKQE